MRDVVFYAPGGLPSLTHAVRLLRQHDCIFSPTPDKTVTHLLLGVPAADGMGNPKGGGTWEMILQGLNRDITVIGGNLNIPALADYKKRDLLQDPFYLSENADITARCALHLAAEKLPVTLKGCPVLVVGWGRIGKCLARLLKAVDAKVTVAARNPKDQAMLRALGYGVTTIQNDMSNYSVLFNTADDCGIDNVPTRCLAIDLASRRGISSDHAIWARGLPGIHAPESSGRLIAQTILQLQPL